MKTVLITGGAKGIGAAMSRAFARAGYCVIINYYHSEEAAKALAADIAADGGNARVMQADVSNPAQVERMIGDILREYRHIDVLINNAGVSAQKLFTETTLDDWRRMMDVDLNAAFYTCKSVLPSMIERQKGKIINISSIWGITGASCEVAYSAAKAGLIGLTKALAKEMGLSNIQVNCIAPGVIDTDMNAHLSPSDIEDLKDATPLARLGTPEEIASLALYLASEAADFITGQVISPNGGFVI